MHKRLCCGVLLMGLVAVAGCDLLQRDKELDPLTEVTENVEEFMQEAAARGLDLRAQADSLTIEVRERLVFGGEEFCGYVPLTEGGKYGTTVLYSTLEQCWGGASEWDREALVFHELGHALLDRDHTDRKLPNGSWASIMRTKNGFGYGVYSDKTVRERREYYLDELFRPNETPVPDWAQ